MINNVNKIHHNLSHIKNTIMRYMIDSNHPPILLVVSKKQPILLINTLFLKGIKDFGETVVQEAERKIIQLSDKINWHYIGNIQSNKIKKIVKYFNWIHTLSNTQHVEKLEECCIKMDKHMKILIQINVDLEDQKKGILIYEEQKIYNMVELILSKPHLILKGLMCILKKNTTNNQKFISFKKLVHLKNKINTLYKINLYHLSMGMTEDIIVALKSGSTIVRIGKGIFHTD